jgi:hypothetical protein
MGSRCNECGQHENAMQDIEERIVWTQRKRAAFEANGRTRAADALAEHLKVLRRLRQATMDAENSWMDYLVAIKHGKVDASQKTIEDRVQEGQIPRGEGSGLGPDR